MAKSGAIELLETPNCHNTGRPEEHNSDKGAQYPVANTSDGAQRK